MSFTSSSRSQASQFSQLRQEPTTLRRSIQKELDAGHEFRAPQNAALDTPQQETEAGVGRLHAHLQHVEKEWICWKVLQHIVFIMFSLIKTHSKGS